MYKQKSAVKSKVLLNESLKEIKEDICLLSSLSLFAGYLNSELASGQDIQMLIKSYLFYSLGMSLEATRMMYSSCSSTLMLGRRHHEGMFNSFWKLFSLHLEICCAFI